jgi:hypothetical protein
MNKQRTQKRRKKMYSLKNFKMMTKVALALSALTFIIFAVSKDQLAGDKEPVEFRTYVATTGDDSKPCTRKAPCRTFQRAHDVVISLACDTCEQLGEPFREVVALDDGEFGPVRITKSVTLTGEGVHAGITQGEQTMDAITLATGPSAVVIIRSLTITGAGIGRNGIFLESPNAPAALHVENCDINGFRKGIFFKPGTTSLLFVKDTFIRDCQADGIFMSGEFGAAKASIDHTRLEHNLVGIDCVSGAKTTIGTSVLSGNDFGAFTSSFAELNIESCLIENNTNSGLEAIDHSTMRVANSTITNNGQGLVSAGSATILSRITGGGVLTNTVEGNGFNGSFNSTYGAK